MQVGSSYLFPLSKIDTRLDGYFVSLEGKMFSTKQSTQGRSMVGSDSYGSRSRYYTMNGCSYEGAVLFLRAKQHNEWKSETMKPAVILFVADHLAAQSKVTDRSHAQAVDQGIKGRGFVVAQVAVHDGQEHLLFGSKPAIHMSEQSYKNEMTRLATMHPGKKFVALKIVASVVSGGVKWE